MSGSRQIIARRSGYLDDIARFDAGLLGTAPRKTLSMAPQRRLMLEAAWEALERAGVATVEVPQSEAHLTSGVRELGAKSLEA